MFSPLISRYMLPKWLDEGVSDSDVHMNMKNQTYEFPFLIKKL